MKTAGAAGTARPKRERTTREKDEKVPSRSALRFEMDVRLMVEFLMPPWPPADEVDASTTIEWSPRAVAESSAAGAARATLWVWCEAMWARRATVDVERLVGRAVVGEREREVSA